MPASYMLSPPGRGPDDRRAAPPSAGAAPIALALAAAVTLLASSPSTAPAQTPDTVELGPSLGSAAAPPAGVMQISVEGAVRRATTVNERVLIARARQAEAAGLVTETRSDALPQIRSNYGYTRNIQNPVLFFGSGDEVQQISIGNQNEHTFGLTLEQSIWDWSLGPARAAARLGRKATAAEVESARTDVALRARRAYYDVLEARELVRVQEQALAQAKSRLEQVRDFYEAGTTSEFDLLTAQVEVENVRPDVIDARNRLELDRNRLKRVTGISLEREITLSDSFPEPGADRRGESEYVKTALERRPDLRSQRLTVDLQHQNVVSEERSDLPDLALTASLQRRGASSEFIPPQEDFSQTATAGFSFSVPLFDGRERAGRVQQARAAQNREQYRLRQLEENIRLEVQQAHQALTSARQRVEATTASVERAERALEIAQTRFQNGLSTQVELNDAELAATRARTNRAEALHDYAVARAELMAATGER